MPAITYLDARTASSPIALRRPPAPAIADPRADTGPDPNAVRTSQLLAALTVALDLTEGLPPGHAARTAYLAMRVADRLGLDAGQRAWLFYASLLKDAGCSSNAAMVSQIFDGDDNALKGRQMVTGRSLLAQAAFTLRSLPATEPLPRRTRRLLWFAVHGRDAQRSIEAVRCERGASIARKAGFPEPVAQAVFDVHEHWDGHGNPRGVRGDAISPLARIVAACQGLELFLADRAPAEAQRILRSRRGSWYEPAVVDALLASCAEGLLDDLAAPDLADRLGALEPAETARTSTASDIETLAEAFADIIDAKSPFTGSHSRNVAGLAEALALRFTLPADLVRDVRRAGLLHDIGKLGVPNTILDKPGRLEPAEMTLIERHPELALGILGRVPILDRVAELAACHHERLDGRGYFRGLVGEELSIGARIIAVADVYEALTADRPYRAALGTEEALAIVRAETGDHLAAEVVAQLPAVIVG